MELRPGMSITPIASVHDLYRNPFVFSKSSAAMIYDVKTNRIVYNNINSGFDLSYIVVGGEAGVIMSSIMTSTSPFAVYQHVVVFYARGRIWTCGGGRISKQLAVPVKYAHYFNAAPLQVGITHTGINVHQHRNVLFIKTYRNSSLVVFPESYTIIITADGPVNPSFIVRDTATQKTYFCVYWHTYMQKNSETSTLDVVGSLTIRAYQITSTQFVYDNRTYLAYDEYVEGVVNGDGRQRLTDPTALDIQILS